MYEKESFQEEKVRLLRSLAFFQSDKLLKKALEYSKSKHVRLQDSYVIPVIEASNPGARALLPSWIMKNWRQFMSIYNSGAIMLVKYVECFSLFSDQDSRDMVAKFFSAKSNRRPDIERGIDQTLERIDANIKFMQANG